MATDNQKTKTAADVDGQGDGDGVKLDKLLDHLTTIGEALSKQSDRLDALEKASKPKDEDDKTKDKDKDDEDPTAIADDDKPINQLSQSEKNARADDLAKAQIRADNAMFAHGKRADKPLWSEHPLRYRVRMANEHSQFSKEYSGVNLAAIAKADPKAFDVIEAKIYADSVAEASRPTMFRDDTIREVRRYDKDMMRDVIEFHGPESYVKQMGYPVKSYVKKFHTQNNFGA
ncbi:MAG: hypothetical protein ACRYGP_08250 [Janthinobacterium lividum]